MERFIRADLAQKCTVVQHEPEEPTVSQRNTVETDAVDFEPINALLRAAEENSIARDQLGQLTPYGSVFRGKKWKVLLKRLVRKLSWWAVYPLTAGQNYYNELTGGISNAVRDSVCMLKDIVAQQQLEIGALKNHIQAQDAQMKGLQQEMQKQKILAEQNEKLSAIEKNLWEQDAALKALETRQQNRFHALRKELRCSTEALHQRYLQSNAELKEALCAQRAEAGEQWAQQQRQIGMLEGFVQTHKDDLSALQAQMDERLQSQQENITDYIDYEDFENTFRGSQSEIRTRIERYLQYFRQGDRVVDLGCGRGEWLELLRGHGAEAVGVDISPAFIQVCKRKGLNVVEQDFFSYLESQPDGSLDGITSIQVIEHLTPVELAKLVQLCCAKLKLGGRLIFETQNPSVVSTMTNYFYIDPTHMRPVHPIWIKYLLEKNYFSEITLDYPEYAWVTDGSIPALDEGIEENELFNQRIAYLNNLLYGSTDYAVIAKR